MIHIQGWGQRVRSIQNIVPVLMIGLCCLAGMNAAMAETGKQEPQWFQCKSAVECTLEHTPCGGPVGVNRQHQEAYRKWAHHQSTMIKCAEAKWPETVCVRCEQAKCVAK